MLVHTSSYGVDMKALRKQPREVGIDAEGNTGKCRCVHCKHAEAKERLGTVASGTTTPPLQWYPLAELII